jgi:hypothetical protein
LSWLKKHQLDQMSIPELRRAMTHVLKDCPDEDAVKSLLGTDSLGDLKEDEACLPQLLHALQGKFGRKVTFKASPRILPRSWWCSPRYGLVSWPVLGPLKMRCAKPGCDTEAAGRRVQ